MFTAKKDGSSRRHIMQGDLPKVGDTVPATFAGEKVSAKVGVVNDPDLNLRDRGRVVVAPASTQAVV